MAHIKYFCTHCGAILNLDENFSTVFCKACGNEMNISDVRNNVLPEDSIKKEAESLRNMAFCNNGIINYPMIYAASEKGDIFSRILILANTLHNCTVTEASAISNFLKNILTEIKESKLESGTFAIDELLATYLIPIVDYKLGAISDYQLVDELEISKSLFEKYELKNKDERYLKAFQLCNYAIEKLRQEIKAKETAEPQKFVEHEVAKKTALEDLENKISEWSSKYGSAPDYNNPLIPTDYKMTGNYGDDYDKRWAAEYDFSLSHDQREAIRDDFYDKH